MPRAAVLGSPIGHSLSPVLHRAAYVQLGLADWTYDAFEVDEKGLPGFIAGLGAEWAGLSLTMPLKRAVIGLLDEISPAAASVRAVNTVLLRDGRRGGDNTDIPGMVAALTGGGASARLLARLRPSGGPDVAVLGGGATAASALAAAIRLEPRQVTAYVRGRARAAEVADLAGRLGARLHTRGWEDAARALSADVVIATTPAGAADHLAAAVPEHPAILFDVVYDPWPTALARAWAAAGGVVLGGLDLLVHQAAAQVRLMTGRMPSVAPMSAAGEAALRKRAADAPAAAAPRRRPSPGSARL